MNPTTILTRMMTLAGLSQELRSVMLAKQQRQEAARKGAYRKRRRRLNHIAARSRHRNFERAKRA